MNVKFWPGTNEGWIVGRQGLLLHTTDDGDHWEVQNSNTQQDLFGIFFLDRNNGWVTGGYKTCLRTRDGGRNWQVIHTEPSGFSHFKGVCFLDTMVGWVVGPYDSILKSTDGGVTWNGIDRSIMQYYLSITFPDSQHGWTASGSHITHTTDGGITWQDTVGVPGDYIDFVDISHGWAVTAGWAVRTTDGGKTWILSNPTSRDLYGVSFADTLHGYVAGGAVILTTSDGGQTWFSQYVTNNFLYGVSAPETSKAFVVGGAGSILKTTNGGMAWGIIRNSDIGFNSLLNGTFYDANQGWAVGYYGVITHTMNGGAVWRLQPSGVSSDLYGVSFADSQYGKICTDGGGVLGTRNGGNTWAGESTGAASPLWSIDYPDTLFAVAVGGYYGPFDSSTVRQLDGSTVTEVPLVKRLEMLKQVSRIEFGTGRHDEEKGIRNDTLPMQGIGLDICKRRGRLGGTNPTTAYRSITRTTNGGATWLAQNTNANPLYGVKFITRGHGWACGDGGTVLHTTDLGATWQTQSTGVSNGLYWITFKDTLHGWTCGSGGRVLWTTDGGNAWNTGNSGVTQYLNSIAFTDTLTGFAVSDNGLIIRSTDGERNWTSDTSKVYANLTAVCALDSTHVWTVGSYGMVLGWGEAGNTGIETRGQGEGETRRPETALGQSYPNPTTGIASFEYELGKPGKVRVKVYNVAGQLVRTLVDSWETVEGPDKQHRDLRYASTGRHVVTWDGRDTSGRKAGSGTYFYQLEAEGKKTTRKMVMIR